jgi:hypothetical protein
LLLLLSLLRAIAMFVKIKISYTLFWLIILEIFGYNRVANMAGARVVK